MGNLQLYPCSMSGPCTTFGCYSHSTYIIARRDLDLGTGVATGYRVCADCAKNLADHIPSELHGVIEGPETITTAEFAAHARAAANAVFGTAELEVIQPVDDPDIWKEMLIEEPEDQFDPIVPTADPAPAEEPDEAYRCLDCNREFINKGSYMRHMQSAIHKK